MAFRGRGKGSSDVIKRGSAFRPAGPDKFELYPSAHEVAVPLELGPGEETLVNIQRLLVNHMLGSHMRVHLGVAESHMKNLNGPEAAGPPEVWKRLAAEIGASYYPADLMTDSRSTLFGGVSKKSSSSAVKSAKSLAALESSEQKAPDGGEGEQSPKSQEDEDVSSSGDSIGGEDYNVRLDFEDEGARDDYEDDEGAGDYGGEF
jgi:hypothetical protein